MKITKIESAIKKSKVGKFKEAADYVTQKYVSDAPNGPALTTESRSVISEVMAGDMATGAELMKNQQTLIGVLIGVTVTVVTFTIIKIYKKRKRDEA